MLPEGPRKKFRLSRYRAGTGSFVIERPHSGKKMSYHCQPRRNSASKGLRATAGFRRWRGRLGTPSNSISQVSGRWCRRGGRKREERRRLGKRLFLVEQTNRVGVKREEKTPIRKQTAGRSMTGCCRHPPFPSKLHGLGVGETGAAHMTRAEAQAVLGSGWRRLPLLCPELTPALALPASPAPCITRPYTRRAAHVHARSLALSRGCCCWVAAAVGFTRRSLTRGRARGDFSHKAFFLSLFFFLVCKTDFYPFPLLASRFNPSRAAGAAAAAALKFIFPLGRGFRIRLVFTSCCCCAQGGKGEQLREDRKGFLM